MVFRPESSLYGCCELIFSLWVWWVFSLWFCWVCLSIINLMSVCALFFIILVGKSSPYHFNASFPLIVYEWVLALWFSQVGHLFTVFCEWIFPCDFNEWIFSSWLWCISHFLVVLISEASPYGFDKYVLSMWLWLASLSIVFDEWLRNAYM